MRALSLLLLVTLLAAAAPAAAQTASVAIQGFAFAPSTLDVETGTTVTWTNQDSAAHTATSTDGPVDFDSGNMDQGDTFSFTFDTPGTYQYRCTYHASMTATVMVADPEGGDDTSNDDGSNTNDDTSNNDDNVTQDGGDANDNGTSREGETATPWPGTAVIVATLAALALTRRRQRPNPPNP